MTTFIAMRVDGLYGNVLFAMTVDSCYDNVLPGDGPGGEAGGDGARVQHRGTEP